MDIKTQLKQEIDQLSESHAEQVLHHVRTLREIPESSETPQARDLQLDIGQEAVELVWWCMRCKNEFPRPLDDPDKCPSCGAPSEELVLREPTRRKAA